MKKLFSVLLSVVLFVSVFGAGILGCKGPEEPTDKPAETVGPQTYADGRARPSNAGRLRVVNGRLSDQDGRPVMLRGVSFNGLITSESFINEASFVELSRDYGVNLVRLAMYTYGVGSVGYCTKGDKERHEADIQKAVQLAKDQDMYVIIDWHILSDGDPNLYKDQAKVFFGKMAELYKNHDNVLYEICNEPNGVDWAACKQYAEEIIPVIREIDPDSVIIVGNPDWSKDLYSVASDPLSFENVLYTLHFYSATHGKNFRDMTRELSQSGLPIFVSEFGCTAASGGLPRDINSADQWIELLEEEHISYCMWAWAKVAEACSAIRSSCLKYSGFSDEDFTDTGLWYLRTLEKYKTR
ncbi:MAG: glycoside hydrolase family 5 protein [Lachnospiraceae bacterium]|nr:glycoside hydrolase family 5 protein [Lachnospiraceae bacterium]